MPLTPEVGRRARQGEMSSLAGPHPRPACRLNKASRAASAGSDRRSLLSISASACCSLGAMLMACYWPTRTPGMPAG